MPSTLSTQIVGEVAKTILLARALTIPQAAEAVVRLIADIEVLAANRLKTFLEVEDRSRIHARYLTCSLTILIPATTIICPHSTLEEFLCPRIVVVNGFFLDINGPTVEAVSRGLSCTYNRSNSLDVLRSNLLCPLQDVVAGK
jgi:hypothetical protein